MKKPVMIILALSMVLLSACSSNSSEKEPTAASGQTQDTTESKTTAGTSATDTSKILGTTATPDTTVQSVQTTTDALVTTTEQLTTSPMTPSVDPETEAPPPTTTEAPLPPQTEAPTPKPTPQLTEAPTPAPTEAPTRAPSAGKKDEKAVADKVVEYINKFRAEEGTPAATKLPGLTVYAEYRSRQLISNFKHDTDDERAAATALKYGEYIDPTLYGGHGEPYYRANAGEAIAKAGYAGSIEYVAESIAKLARNSAGHWRYVGGEDYKYIAVGVTYESGLWYCDIAMARENTDEIEN